MDFIKNLFKGRQKRKQVTVEPQKQMRERSKTQKAEVTISQAINKQLTVKELVDEGVYKKRHGDYVGAKESYYQAIRVDPTQRMSFYALAKVCYLTNEKNESILNYLRAAHLSIPTLVKVISSDPTFKRALEQQVRQISSDILSALRATHKYAVCLLIDPDTPIHLAHSVFDLDNKSSIPSELVAHIATYRQVLAGRDGNLNYSIEDAVYRPLGIKFLIDNLKWGRLGDSDVLSIYPDPTTRRSRSQSDAKGVQSFANPNTPEAHCLLAHKYEVAGHTDDAIREYQAAIGIDANCVEAHYKLGQIYYATKELLDEGQRELEIAVSIKPDFIPARYNLSWVYLRKQRVDDAIRELQTIVQIDPNASQAHYHLAVIYKDQSRPNEAVREAYLAANLGFGPAVQLLENLMKFEAEDDEDYDEDWGDQDWDDEDQDSVMNARFEHHHSWVSSCITYMPESDQICDTLISIPLDMGSSAFRCPGCGAVYCVDPIKKASRESGECGFMEHDNHHIEIWSNEEIRNMDWNELEYQAFLITKVGNLERFYLLHALQ